MLDRTIDLSPLRACFPALQQTDENGRPHVYFDGPGGTQVPQAVIDAIADYFTSANANCGGPFITSLRNDEMILQARKAMADFLNAGSDREIVFGANMTTLTFSFSRAIGRALQPGDEIIVTNLDHDANISPWLALEEKGIIIRWTDFNIEDCRLNLDHLASLLSKKTKLVALGYASNAVGTINPIKTIAAMAHVVGAQVWVDAVHFAPHRAIDVQAIDCDFLVCSAYKFFGPHVGVLWGKQNLLEQLAAYKVRPANPAPPHKFETGRLNHEGLAGVLAAVEYLAQIGRKYGNRLSSDLSNFKGRRKELKQAMGIIEAYEGPLFSYMLAKLKKISGIKVYGILDADAFDERCPTLAFTRNGYSPKDIATKLGEKGIFVWHGNYYALAVTKRLGVEDSGGMVRVGLAHYNTKDEVDRFLAVLKKES
ncbi:MAG: cysteine desulfurase-like protein [Deltaproteobacteria bacterium]|jgi:cysteine desulfurase family protein (TIGR01976 family)|nr:cysteine desulfurase-like protein [Deltaproteobacteria bacterium]